MHCKTKKRLCWKLQDTNRTIEQNEKSRHLFKTGANHPGFHPVACRYGTIHSKMLEMPFADRGIQYRYGLIAILQARASKSQQKHLLYSYLRSTGKLVVHMQYNHKRDDEGNSIGHGHEVQKTIQSKPHWQHQDQPNSKDDFPKHRKGC